MWIDGVSAVNVKEESVWEDGGFTEVQRMSKSEDNVVKVKEEGEIVKSFMRDYGTWKDDAVVIGSLIEEEEGEFVELGGFGNSGNRGENQSVVNELPCSEKFEPTLLPEDEEGTMFQKFPRRRMSKIQYLNKLMGKGSTFTHKQSNQRMSKKEYLNILMGANQISPDGCERQDPLDKMGECQESVQQSDDESFGEENSSRGNKFESFVKDHVKERRDENDDRDSFNRLSEGETMKRPVVTECAHGRKDCDGKLVKGYMMDNCLKQSFRSNASQSDSRPAAYNSKLDKEIRSFHGEMGMDYMDHSRETSCKTKCTDKSNEKANVDARMDPPECPLRFGNSKPKPSLSCSHGVRRCTEKKCEFRHHSSGARKHKIQVNVPRAKVQRAIRLFRATFRALFLDNYGDSAGRNGVKIKRFDLMSATILKKNNEWVNSGRQIVGTVPGVEIGDEYHYRVELVLIGLHRQYESGIDYLNEDGRTLATSIVASGVYADYMHDSDVLDYCGHGGNPQRKKSGGDQKLKRGNLALKNSMNAKSPVRVIRGFKEAKGNETLLERLDMDGKLVYDGLYMVEHYWEEQGQHGNTVFKFRLRRIPGQPAINWLKKSEKANHQ